MFLAWQFLLLLSINQLLSAYGGSQEDRTEEHLHMHEYFEQQLFPKLTKLDWSDLLEPLGTDAASLGLDFSGDEVEAQDNCNTCRTAVSAVSALVALGNTYEDLKNLTMNICYEVVPPWDPDLLCEGALDNYGPHVVYILNVTDKRPLDICLQLNYCYPDNSNDTSSVIFPADPEPIPSKHDFKKRDVEGALRVLHLSDIHVDEFYTEGAAPQCDMPLCCRRNYPGEGSAEHWGTYPCNIPYRTVDRYFDYLSTLEPDMIMYTGDSAPHTIWLETQAGQLNVSEQVADYFQKYFPGVPTYTTIANHDIYPTNLYYMGRPEIQEANVELTKYWENLSGFGDEQKATMAAGGYYSVLVRDGLRVLSWNSNYASTDNFYNVLTDVDGPDYVAMKEYFVSELTKARSNGEKVIVIGHHPSGSSGAIDYDGYFLVDLFTEFGDIVVFYLLGHHHSDEYRIFSDLETLEPKVVGFSGATMGTYTNNNPSAKMFYLDPETFVPLDATGYHVNMREYGDAEDLVVEEVYSYSSDYGVEDLTVESMRDLADRFRSDEELLWRYRYNADTRHTEPGNCDDWCVHWMLCQMLNPVNELTRKCRGQ